MLAVGIIDTSQPPNFESQLLAGPSHAQDGTCYGGAITFPRITIRPDQMGGAPCIRALRIPVSVVVDMAADGIPVDTILALYPDLEREDIQAALEFAAQTVRR